MLALPLYNIVESIHAGTSFDPIVYDADWLDEDMWSLRVLPKLGIKLEENDFDNIKGVLTFVDYLGKKHSLLK